MKIFAILAALALAFPAAAGQPTAHAFPDDLAPVYLRDAQDKLRDKGYYKGKTDGATNAGFVAAVRKFQKDAGLPVTGVADDALIQTLHFAQVDAPTPAVKTAPVPDAYVRWAQDILTQQGLYTGNVDGLAGPATRAAVLRYEAQNDLPLTGVVRADLVKHLVDNQKSTAHVVSQPDTAPPVPDTTPPAANPVSILPALEADKKATTEAPPASLDP